MFRHYRGKNTTLQIL